MRKFLFWCALFSLPWLFANNGWAQAEIDRGATMEEFSGYLIFTLLVVIVSAIVGAIMGAMAVSYRIRLPVYVILSMVAVYNFVQAADGVACWKGALYGLSIASMEVAYGKVHKRIPS